MNRLPNIEMKPAEELQAIAEDLKIIDNVNEDLKTDPFIRDAPIIPEQPKVVKRAASAKQKTHLANARKLAKEQKNKQKQEKIMPVDEIQEPIKIEPKIEEIQEQKPTLENFEQWCNNMDKFAEIQKKIREQEQKQEEERAKKEAETEAKYFKKFQEMKAKAEPINVVEQETVKNDYGIYSDYF